MASYNAAPQGNPEGANLEPTELGGSIVPRTKEKLASIGLALQEAAERVQNNGELSVVFATDPELIQRALVLEQEVWDQKEYGSLDDYAKYLSQSRVFVALDGHGECKAVSRIFTGHPELPPFLDSPEFEFYDQTLKQELVEGCKSNTVEELATAAVSNDAPAVTLNLNIWRHAYRDAYERGVKKWGIIMEPERVRIMNRRFGFNFEQVGSEVFYQGGYCAPHLLDLEDVRAHMQEIKPDRFRWFVVDPL